MARRQDPAGRRCAHPQQGGIDAAFPRPPRALGLVRVALTLAIARATGPTLGREARPSLAARANEAYRMIRSSGLGSWNHIYAGNPRAGRSARKTAPVRLRA